MNKWHKIAHGYFFYSSRKQFSEKVELYILPFSAPYITYFILMSFQDRNYDSMFSVHPYGVIHVYQLWVLPIQSNNQSFDCHFN